MPEPRVHVTTGGTGPKRVLLLHGSGATAAVWSPVTELLRNTGDVGWIAVDLPGHGRSGHFDPSGPAYDHLGYAAAVAAAVADLLPRAATGPRVDMVVGHSLGALVALALADNDNNLDVGAVIAIAMKVRWTPEQLERRAATAARPVKVFADRQAAVDRFALVSGMSPDSFDTEELATGIRPCDGGFRLAVDPRITATMPASESEIAAVAAAVGAPVDLLCGDNDPGIAPAEMAEVLGGDVRVEPGAGHNLHVDRPATVVDMIGARLAGPPSAGRGS